MSLRFYMDHHVPSAITRGLRRRGIDVLTAEEDGTADLPDEILLQRATDLDYVVFSQDEDFLELANEWMTTAREFSGIVCGHQLSVTIGAAVLDLELIGQIMQPDEIINRVVYIPL